MLQLVRQVLKNPEDKTELYLLFANQVTNSIAYPDPLSYFPFQPVLHDWCTKGRGMCNCLCHYAYKRTLAVNRKE